MCPRHIHHRAHSATLRDRDRRAHGAPASPSSSICESVSSSACGGVDGLALRVKQLVRSLATPLKAPAATPPQQAVWSVSGVVPCQALRPAVREQRRRQSSGTRGCRNPSPTLFFVNVTKFEHEFLSGVDDASRERDTLAPQPELRIFSLSTPTCTAASSSSSQSQSQPAARSPRPQQQPPRPAS